MSSSSKHDGGDRRSGSRDRDRTRSSKRKRHKHKERRKKTKKKKGDVEKHKKRKKQRKKRRHSNSSSSSSSSNNSSSSSSLSDTDSDAESSSAPVDIASARRLVSSLLARYPSDHKDFMQMMFRVDSGEVVLVHGLDKSVQKKLIQLFRLLRLSKRRQRGGQFGYVQSFRTPKLLVALDTCFQQAAVAAARKGGSDSGRKSKGGSDSGSKRRSGGREERGRTEEKETAPATEETAPPTAETAPPSGVPIGPVIPSAEELVRMRDAAITESNVADVGPKRPGQATEEEEAALDHLRRVRENEKVVRALEKERIAAGGAAAGHEEWMTVLPDAFKLQGGVESVTNRTFSAQPRGVRGDTSAWTDTPQERQRRREGLALRDTFLGASSSSSSGGGGKKRTAEEVFGEGDGGGGKRTAPPTGEAEAYAAAVKLTEGSTSSSSSSSSSVGDGGSSSGSAAAAKDTRDGLLYQEFLRARKAEKAAKKERRERAKALSAQQYEFDYDTIFAFGARREKTGEEASREVQSAEALMTNFSQATLPDKKP